MKINPDSTLDEHVANLTPSHEEKYFWSQNWKISSEGSETGAHCTKPTSGGRGRTIRH
jgi:hypothetical protein